MKILTEILDTHTKKYKICSVTGHKPNNFPWNYHEKKLGEHQEYLQTLTQFIENLITEENYNYFITGASIGVETDFAEILISLRDSKYPDIKLEIAVPFENQDLKWNQKDKDKYRQIISQADFVTVLSKRQPRFRVLKCNKYMLNKSDSVLVVWNTEISKGSTCDSFKYMNRKKIDYEIIGLQDFLVENKRIESLLQAWGARIRSEIAAQAESAQQVWEQLNKRLIDEGLWHFKRKKKRT